MVKSFQMYSLMVVFLILIVLSCSSNLRQNSSPIVKDVDGNRYRIVKIGDQWWMAENLKVKHYRNGDPIPNVSNSSKWSNLSTGAYCIYGNNKNHPKTYGNLYNWYAIADNRKIAPVGWHVPSDEEWQTLIEYLGGSSEAGGKMKETGTAHWNNPNIGATNESGLTVLPGGCRGYDEYISIGKAALFWTSSEYLVLVQRHSDYKPKAWDYTLIYDDSWISRNSSGTNKKYGYSVRCVKD